MANSIIPSSSPLIRKIESNFDLSLEERQAIESLPVHVRPMKPGSTIVREGDRPSQCCVILAGLACRARVLNNGSRQILSFHLPGDIADLQSWHMDLMDHDLVMLRAGRVAFIPHAAISAVMERHPRVAIALWRDALIDAAITREWLVGVGRKSSYVRVAHLLCELIARARGVDPTAQAIDHLPTQQEFGDATGLSIVHINRTMRKLRTDRLITTAGRRLNVLDWDGLKQAGQFNQTYLRLEVQV